MRHIIYLPFFALLAASGGDSSSLSMEALKNQLGHLQNLKKLSADFEQTRRVKEWGTEVKTSGSFEVTKKDKPLVIWQIKKPSPTAMKMEGDQIMIQMGPSPWKPLDNPKVVAQMKNIFAWLAMDTEKIGQDFSVSQKGDREFLLKPIAKESIFKGISIHLNSQKLVEKIVMLENGEDSITIQFSNTLIKR